MTIGLAGTGAAAGLVGTRTAGAVNGVATFANLSARQASPALTLVAAAQGLEPVSSAPFAISPNTPARLVFEAPPTPSFVGIPIVPALRVGAVDQSGNPAASFSGNVSIDELIHEYGLPCPNYIKIDVPALTGAIIEGGARTLQRPQLRELHIEASEESTGGRRLVERLAQAGFTIAARHVHGETTDLTFVRSE